MKLGEKEFFRIYAYSQIMEQESSYKMSLVLNHTMDYKNVLSQPSRVYHRIANLVFGENTGRNVIFFRPLEIQEGDHVEVIFKVKEHMAPFFLEIGTYGAADDLPKGLIVINHTETVVKFEGNSEHAYDIAIERSGEELDSLWKKECLEGTEAETICIQLKDVLCEHKRISENAEAKLQSMENEENILKKQISELKQELKNLQETRLDTEKNVKQNEEDILEKKTLSEKIAEWFPEKKKRLEALMEDLEMTSGERERKKESYRKHVDFLTNIEKYYKEKNKDEEFAECLQFVKEKVDELAAYFLKLEEIEEHRSVEETEGGK